MNLTATDVKVFVPAKNFLQSLQFYEALGWRVNFRADGDAVAELELANVRFYLQNFYHRAWAENFMLHITVDDARAWWAHATQVIAAGDYGAARVVEPQMEPYGALVTYVWDPCGVLLHFAQPIQTAAPHGQ